MTVTDSVFGRTPEGAEVMVHQLEVGGARVRVSDFGATIVGIDVPDSAGELADVVLGYGDLAGYLGPNPACYGGTIGPVANRTDRAEIIVDGRTYHLTGNDGPDGRNNLHTDLAHGLHKRLWTARREGDALVMTCELADGELGLPGNRRFTASFSLAEMDSGAELVVSYRCETDAPTFVNMTNHTYFNLAGHDAGPVDGHVVEVRADAFLPLREDSVSAGQILPVTGTPFDFTSPKELGCDVEADDEQIRRARGYDHCLCVRGYEPDALPRPALEVWEPASRRALEIFITAPGAHLYTGNWLDDRNAKCGATYAPRSGFAFEPEFYPDCVHHAEWSQPRCEPGCPYASTIVYRFGTRA